MNPLKSGTFFKSRRTTAKLLKLLSAVTLSLSLNAQAQDRIFEVNGGMADESLGQAITCAGPNVFVGVPGAKKSGVSRVGEVRVFDFSSKNLLYTIINPSTANPDLLFGATLKMFPDSNNNGLQEILVGAPTDVLSYATGIVRLFDHGGSQTPLQTITGLSGESFGASLALIDAPLSDGFVDVAIGAPDRNLSSASGIVQIRDIKNAATLQTIFAPFDIDALGTSIATLPDYDQNGSPDLLIGAPGSHDSEGAALIYSLSQVSSTMTREIRGGSGNMRFGTSVAALPDSNGDSIDDILIGGPSTDGAKGLVRLYSGADVGSGAPSISPICEISGTVSGQRLGSAVASVGDFDGDGITDFAVGAPGSSTTDAGEIKIYHFRQGFGCELVTTLPGNGDENLGHRIFFEPCGANAMPPFRLAAGSNVSTGGAVAGSAIVFDKIATPTPTPTVTPTPTATPEAAATPGTPAHPTSAKLTFRISETGEFRIQRTYDQEPGRKCSSRLYGRVVVGGIKYGVESLLEEKFSDEDRNERITVFRLLNFPRARKLNQRKPIINMLVETACDGKSFDSNVFARYMICGDPDKTVSIPTWLATLKDGLNSDSAKQTVRAGRNIRLVKLKARRSH